MYPHSRKTFKFKIIRNEYEGWQCITVGYCNYIQSLSKNALFLRKMFTYNYKLTRIFSHLFQNVVIIVRLLCNVIYWKSYRCKKILNCLKIKLYKILIMCVSLICDRLDVPLWVSGTTTRVTDSYFMNFL